MSKSQGIFFPLFGYLKFSNLGPNHFCLSCVHPQPQPQFLGSASYILDVITQIKGVVQMWNCWEFSARGKRVEVCKKIRWWKRWEKRDQLEKGLGPSGFQRNSISFILFIPLVGFSSLFLNSNWIWMWSFWYWTLQFVLTRIKYGPARYWAILFVFWFLVFGIWASRTHGAHAAWFYQQNISVSC